MSLCVVSVIIIATAEKRTLETAHSSDVPLSALPDPYKAAPLDHHARTHTIGFRFIAI